MGCNLSHWPLQYFSRWLLHHQPENGQLFVVFLTAISSPAVVAVVRKCVGHEVDKTFILVQARLFFSTSSTSWRRELTDYVSLYVWWCPSSESLSWCKEVQYHLGLLGWYLYLMGLINQLTTAGVPPCMDMVLVCISINHQYLISISVINIVISNKWIWLVIIIKFG